jgi:hypothetical protein
VPEENHEKIDFQALPFSLEKSKKKKRPSSIRGKLKSPFDDKCIKELSLIPLTACLPLG